MRMLCRKLICSLMALAMLTGLIPALAETTSLKIEFSALYATVDGAYRSVAVSGDFDVYQDDALVGRIHALPDGENTLVLPGAGSVRIAPVAETLPGDVPLNPYGYGVNIAPGRLNIAPISAHAEAGLFMMEGLYRASFELVDKAESAEEEDCIVLAFETDAEGRYVPEMAVPFGSYTLRMTAADGPLWPDIPVEIVTYTGEESILKIGVPQTIVEALATTVPTFTPEPTAAPTATPTIQPTATPTATPVPAPTATPIPQEGGLRISVEGAGEASYALTNNGVLMAQGTVSEQAFALIEALPAGEYLVTLTLPENLVLTALNGNAVVQRGSVQWMAPVAAMQESAYTLTLSETGAVSVPTENVTGAAIVLAGPRESREANLNENSLNNLLPDEYTVTVTLPDGRYTAEGWTLTESRNGYTAAASCVVKPGETAELPLIRRDVTGSVKGEVADSDGKHLRGVKVTVYNADGQAVAEAETDKQGAWQVPSLVYGEYIAQYTEEGSAIPASVFTLDDDHVAEALKVRAAAPARITVHAFLDENNNGSMGKGEDDFKGAEVALIDQNGVLVDTGVTGWDGCVTLSAPEGEYRLRVTVPADHAFGRKGSGLKETQSYLDETDQTTQESGLITLRADVRREAGVGVVPTATVRGVVWDDLNGDGLWQEGEPGIPGIRMTIKGGKARIEHETVTDENGFYEFRQILKGYFTLSCHIPDDRVFTIKAKGELPEISRMTTEAQRIGQDEFYLEWGEIHEDHNIGLMSGAIIEGVCFLDDNYNGYFDEGEPVFPGVELRLVRQSNNVLQQTVVSDENGVFRFKGQRGSTFLIRAILPEGSVFTALAEGEDGNRFAPKGDSNECRLNDVTLADGGYMKLMLGAITYGGIEGRVYYDEDYSGTWQKGEETVRNVTVTLYDEAGTAIATDKTDRNGQFSFAKLTPGNYRLGMDGKKGYAFAGNGSHPVTTLEDGSGRSDFIPLTMGRKITDADLGLMVPAVVTGTFFADDNDNGMRDSGEKGLKGTSVRLMNEDGEAASAQVAGDGSFRFNAVIPGRYYLEYVLPEHGIFAKAVQGGNTLSGENGTARGEWFSVQKGDTWQAPLGGGLTLSNISGVAFEDRNGSGVMDADEAPVAGFTVTLTPTRPELSAVTAVTGEDGRFAIENLLPDTYTMTVTCPGEYVLSRLSGVDMGVRNGMQEQSFSFYLDMGTQWNDQMLGCVLPSSWSGEVWLDENYDGVRNAQEAPAVGETLELRDAATGETVLTAVTDENGFFTVKGIAPGEYELVYPLDAGNLMPKDGSLAPWIQRGNALTSGRVTINENEDKSGTVLCVVRTTEIAGQVLVKEYDGIDPVRGAKVHLLDASGKVISEFITAEDGKYAFPGLMPADYALDVTVPAGYVLAENNDPQLTEAGLNSFVADAQGHYGRSETFALRMAGHLLDMDVVMVLPGRLGDKAWLDLNGNGLQDGEEGGIPGVTIELLRGGKVVGTAVTDQYGYYVFEDLYPTEYILRVTAPAEVKPTTLRPEIHQISSVLQEDGLSIPVTVESNKANYAADLGFVLVEEGKYPAGYGEGETQNWKKKR